MMTPFTIYLLVGALWSLICKWSGEIDKQLEEDNLMSNNLTWQLLILGAIILFWAPIMVAMGLGKRKGDNE